MRTQSAVCSFCRRKSLGPGLVHRFFELLGEEFHELFPGVITSPYAMTGGTDARFFAPVTENALRFAPLEIDEQQYKSIHALNENICIDTLPKGVEFYKAIVKKM